MARAGTALGAIVCQVRSGAAAPAGSAPQQGLMRPQSYPLLGNGTVAVGGVPGLQAQLTYNVSTDGKFSFGSLRYGQPRGHQRIESRELKDGGWQLEATSADQGGLVAFGNNLTSLGRAQVDDNVLFWNFTNPVFLSASLALRAFDGGRVADLLEISFAASGGDDLQGLSLEIFNVSTRWTMNIRPANDSALRFVSEVVPFAQRSATADGPSSAAAPSSLAVLSRCVGATEAAPLPFGRTQLVNSDGVVGMLQVTQESLANDSEPSIRAEIELTTVDAWSHRLTLTRDDSSMTFALRPATERGFDVLGVQAPSVAATGVTSQLLALQPQGEMYASVRIDAFTPDEAPHVVISVSSTPAVGLVSCRDSGQWALRLEAQASSTIAAAARPDEG